MFSFFASKHVKQGRQFVKDGRKLLDYKRDLWTPAQVRDFEGAIAELERTVKGGEQAPIEKAAHALDGLCGQFLPPVKDAGWRENCEVFLVAIVVALGVRTYFLQPFTIPTGSMQPTLNGILGHPTKSEPPNFLVRLFHTAAFGRGWVNVLAKDDETIIGMKDGTRFFVFTATQVQTDKNIYSVGVPARTLQDAFGLSPGRLVKRGEPIARGYVDTGDHVFVDKMTYHFRRPQRGDVFVFNTQDISMQGKPKPGPPPRDSSQFYIKRLVGKPGDELRIAPPELFINGRLAEGAAFARVMSEKDGYRGYSNAAEFIYPDGQAVRRPMEFLGSPETTLKVPDGHYWAQGDNSFHSSDSRDWGAVPERNIMGRGVWVYWPFASHWGLIK